MSTDTPPPFASADRAARWTAGLLIATVVLSAAGVASALLQLELLSRIASGGVSDAEAAANDARQQLIAVLQLLLIPGTGAAFLVWFHRMHRNLPALGARNLKYSPGWAVGGFFVPFLNLVRPFQVMREVWHHSDPGGIDRDGTPDRPAVIYEPVTPPLVGWWWGLFLGSSLLGSAAARFVLVPDPNLGQMQTMTALQAAVDGLEIPSALVALRLVKRLTAWQVQRAAGTGRQNPPRVVPT